MMTLPLAVAQIRPEKPRFGATLERLGGLFGRMARRDTPPRLLVLPETALTGYFLEGGVRGRARTAREVFDALRDLWIRESGGGEPLAVVLGFYERAGDRVHNSALCAELGGDDPGVLHLHRKVFLPTYGVFQERRFLEPGSRISAFDAPWGRSALLVCEDAWHSLSATLAALDGARFLIVSSASPAHGPAGGPAGRGGGGGRTGGPVRDAGGDAGGPRGPEGRGDVPEPGDAGRSPTGRASRPADAPCLPGSLDRWYRLLRGTAEEHGVFVVFAQLVGSEAGKVMPGGSAVFDPHGRLLARAPLWEEALLETELDPGAVARARARAGGASPLLADLEEALPRLLGSGIPGRERTAPDHPGSLAVGDRPAPRTRSGELFPRGAPPGGDRSGREPARGGPDPDDPSPLEIEPALVEEWLVHFLRQELDARGFPKFVVGLSGGPDSALAAALARRAVGPDRLHALFLPGEATPAASRDAAEEMATRLGVDLRVVDLSAALDAYFDRHEPDASPRRRADATARQRALVLFDQGQRHDALPLGTVNKSERLLGSFTWRGEDAPPLHPLGDLFRTQVRQLGRAMELPERVLGREPTAGLPGAEADESGPGVPYRTADLVLHHLLAGYAPEELIAGGFDPEAVRRVVARLHDSHHRRNLPTVAMLTPTAVGEGYLRPPDYRPG